MSDIEKEMNDTLKEVVQDYQPKSGFLVDTSDCNNDPPCLYCRSYKEVSKDKPLTLLEKYGVIDQMIDLGVNQLTLTGGEPFLNPNLADLVKYACNRDMKVIIATNGKLLTGEFLSGIDKNKVRIQVSLDSIYKEINDTLRGEGSYDAAIRALDLCKEYDVKSQTSITITGVNLDSIPDTIEDAISNGSLVKLRQMVVIGRGESHRELMVDDNELNNLITKYVLNPEYKGRVDIEQVPYFSKNDPKAAKVCSAGNGIIYVEHDGAVGICPSAKHFVSNVRDKSLKEIYRDMSRFREEGHIDSGFCGRKNVLSLGNGELYSKVAESYTDFSRKPMSAEVFGLFGCKCTG
ncbi:MAG: radical SAM protein [archaeon]